MQQNSEIPHEKKKHQGPQPLDCKFLTPEHPCVKCKENRNANFIEGADFFSKELSKNVKTTSTIVGFFWNVVVQICVRSNKFRKILYKRLPDELDHKRTREKKKKNYTK
jgi:hypothetical protein